MNQQFSSAVIMSGSTAKRSRRCLKNGKDVSASYREREERVRQAREKHEEERMKNIDDIKLASLAHQRYRGQLEEQRKRRIDDVRTCNNERQSAVLERRRQILEAEMDRRDAKILRKLSSFLCWKLEREAKLEAKRNAMSFAFGSGSTPRLYESCGMSNSQSTVYLVLPANVNTTPTSRRSARLNRNFNGSASKPMRAKSATNTDKTHEQDVSTAKQAPQKEKIKSKPAVAKKQEMKPNKSKTPSKSSSPDLHIAVQASGDNFNGMVSKPDIVPDETLVNAPATDQPFAQDDKSLSPNHDKMSPPPSLLEQTPSGKQTITSEEEAKVALAERRRQAREHAEREAEKERLRLEQLECQGEERIKKEEEEARKAELEQIRLAEEHRQLEEEKLLKAIEDKEKKDEEEQEIC